VDRREEIIQEIYRVAKAIEPAPLTQQAFVREGRIPESTLRYYFPTWNEAVSAAGLKPNPKGVSLADRKSLDEIALLDAIGDIWRAIGKRPTEGAMNSQGTFSVHPYKQRWGKWSKAVNEYVRRYGEPVVTLSTNSSGVPAPAAQARATPPRLMLAPTHKPKEVANRRRILYGEPIEFRGLRYAPINEQGVVYLFGMVSRELGFLVESVRTDYPDCEGKRALDRTGTQWQHVRIEFEYKSSNFLAHGHDPDECELIVCWIHDWLESPIEVLELRSAIALLPNQ